MTKKTQIIFTPITSLWYEDQQLFIRAKERAGLFIMPLSKTQELHFLSDVFHEDTENGRVFKLVGVEYRHEKE